MFRTADRLGWEVATGWSGPLTYLQYQVYLTWLAKEETRTSRTHYHLMQVAAEVRRSYVNHRDRVRLSDFDLPTTEDEGDPGTREIEGGRGEGDTAGGETPASGVQQRSPSAHASPARPSPPGRSYKEAPKLTEEEREWRAKVSRARWGGIMTAHQLGAKAEAREGGSEAK